MGRLGQPAAHGVLRLCPRGGVGGRQGGIGNAAGVLADYYVKRAEQYQPVIEMPTGIEVELVLLTGFQVQRQAPAPRR